MSLKLNLGRNIVASGIILCTLMLIWIIFFSPKDDITDPSPFIGQFPSTIVLIVLSFLNSPLFLISILCIIVYLTQDPLLLFIFNPFLNKCSYCLPIRGEPTPYLINGYCTKCKTHVCSKCFKCINKQKKKPIGCPNCGGGGFTYKKSIAYIRLPRIIRSWMIRRSNRKNKKSPSWIVDDF